MSTRRDQARLNKLADALAFSMEPVDALIGRLAPNEKESFIREALTQAHQTAQRGASMLAAEPLIQDKRAGLLNAEITRRERPKLRIVQR